MATSTLDDVLARAGELARSAAPLAEATEQLLAVAGGDRKAVEQARDRAASRVHAHVDDFDATAALQLLNRVLAELPIHDPLDWRVRWTQRFRRP